MVMATTFVRVGGGLVIVMRPMAKPMAKTIPTIWAMWTRNFKLSSKDLIEDNMLGGLVACDYVVVWIVVWRFGVMNRMEEMS